MSGILEAHNLTKVYGDLTAVDNVTRSVEKGELFALLGPNGRGNGRRGPVPGAGPRALPLGLVSMRSG